MLKPTFKNCYLGRSKNYSLKYGLYMTIWKLANRNSFREVSGRFGVAHGSAYRIFIKCVTLIANLKSKVIRFPRTATSQRKLIEEFEKIRGRPFPNTIGCIDGMHISINNRKGFYSILVQGIVDSKIKFSDAFLGYPGIISIPPENQLIGDGAYSLQMYMMTPFKDNGHLTEKETRYNTALSSNRVLVEQAFGISKKWRMLHHLKLHNLSLAKTIIMAAIALQNIVIDHEGVDENDTNRINIENIISTTTSTIKCQLLSFFPKMQHENAMFLMIW
ncbi:uncharacterized protein LOC129616457 [Condylostylus longicornis]|uniref:uncharacterized protein LOC129616457 n=1 Tax=Condylostylus longicornis TaxID=2530218 RepID=UPI00244E0CB0|nr:uncharacterized protein LOC129616457 [Condylostylus longicornis]